MLSTCSTQENIQTLKHVDWDVKHQLNIFLHYGESDLGLLCLSMSHKIIKDMLGLYGLICAIIKQCCVSVLSLYFTIQLFLPCIWSLFHKHTSNPLTSMHLEKHLHCRLLILCKGAYSKTCLKQPLKKNTKIVFQSK